MTHPICVAFRQTYDLATPEIITYAARWLACKKPSRRFTSALADDGGRRWGCG
jgi:hypothetical protein